MMTTKKTLLVLSAAAMIIGAAPLRAQQANPPAQQPAQQQPPAQQPPAQQPPAQQPPAQDQQQASITTGELLKVDATAKTVEVKPATGASMVFKYTDTTKVTGADRGTAGLATMTGSRVSVRHMKRGEDNIASEIEVLEAKK